MNEDENSAEDVPFEPSDGAADAFVDQKSEAEEASEQPFNRSVEDWTLPGTDAAVRVCASPEGLGTLARHELTLTDAFTKALGLLLQMVRRRKAEPLMLTAVDIPPAA